MRGHVGRVNEASFDRTGGRLATIGDDGTVRVWDVETERQVQLFQGHGRHQRDLRLSGLAALPDDSQLVTSGFDGAVRLWTWRGPGGGDAVLTTAGLCRSVAASPDGRLLAASGRDGRLYLCDRTATPVRLHVWRLFEWGGHWLHGVAFSPEGRYLATSNPDGTVYVFRLARRGEVPRLPERPGAFTQERAFDGHQQTWIGNLCLSPDGSVAWTAGNDRTRAWRVGNAEQVDELPGEGTCHVALAPDGKAAVTAHADGRLRRWRLDAPAGPQVWGGHTSPVEGLAWSGDGKIVVSGSRDGTVRVWGLDGKTIHVLRGHASWVSSVAVHKDGRRVLSSGAEGTVRLWDLRDEKDRRVWACEGVPEARRRGGYCASSVCFAPDGRRAAWGGNDGTVRVVDLGDGREVLRLDVGSLWARALCFSPDGKRLLAGGYQHFTDGTLALFDAETGRRIDYLRCQGGVTGVAFTPDGRAVTSHGDGRARVWRLP
jgi:WD40 repeat protein